MTIPAKVDAYFRAEERGDVEAVVAMCSDDVVVRNAANPPQHGKDGVRPTSPVSAIGRCAGTSMFSRWRSTTGPPTPTGRPP